MGEYVNLAETLGIVLEVLYARAPGKRLSRSQGFTWRGSEELATFVRAHTVLRPDRSCSPWFLVWVEMVEVMVCATG